MFENKEFHNEIVSLYKEDVYKNTIEKLSDKTLFGVQKQIFLMCYNQLKGKKNKSKLLEILACYYMFCDSLINEGNISEDKYIHQIHDDLRKSGDLKQQKGNRSTGKWKATKVFLTYSNIKEEPTFDTISRELRKIDKEKYDKKNDRYTTNPDALCNFIDSFFIVKERHQTGVAHYHVLVHFTKERSFNLKDFDLPCLNHPNVSTIGKSNNVVKYMCKYLPTDATDNELKELLYDYDFVYKRYLNSNGYSLSTLGRLVMDKAIGLKEVIDECPSMIFKFSRIEENINRYNEFKENIQIKLKGLKEFFIGKNNLKFTFDFTKRKQENPQYWICGGLDSGKTYFIEQLEKLGYKGYLGSKENDWDGYEDTTCDFIYFEEYGGENEIRFMNQLLEGTKMYLKRKFKRQYLKKENKPVFICSNMLPHQAYKKVATENPKKFELLMSRLKVVYLDKKHDAHLLWDPKEKKKYNYDLLCEEDDMMKNYINNIDIKLKTSNLSDYTNVNEYRRNTTEYISNVRNGVILECNNEVLINRNDDSIVTTKEFVNEIPDNIPILEAVQIVNGVEQIKCKQCGEGELIFGNDLCLSCKYGGGVHSW